MIVRSIAEAQAGFSALIDHVRAGGEVVIEDAGKPVARLVACGDAAPKLLFADDFDELPDAAAAAGPG